MIGFSSFSLEKELNYIRLSAQMVVQFEHAGDESYCVGTPRCWDDALLPKLCIANRDIHFICMKKIAYRCYNRITDYKGVWELLGESPGEYNSYYDIPSGRIYWGIKKAKNITENDIKKSPMLILTKQGQILPYEAIFSCFADTLCGLDIDELGLIVKRIHNILPDSVVLCYCARETANLHVCGDNAESLIGEAESEHWEGVQWEVARFNPF